jgi:hypothetical protein
MAISKINSNSLQDDIQLQGQTVKLPVGAQTARPTGTTDYLKGQTRFNDTAKKTELHNGRNWDVINTQATSIALGIALGG